MQQSSNFSLHGAVDLGARQAAAKRRQASAAAGGGSPYVIEVTDATFNSDVVARSQSVPVIVDLWAEWCGPCKQLGPVLERLAAEGGGSWVLAKVDVDANPQISAAFGVQSIPMVVAIVGGQPVSAFLGAQPEPQVRQWIGQVVQAAGQAGDGAAAQGGAGAAPGAGGPGAPGGPGGPQAPGDHRLAAAQRAMEIGDLNGAANALEQVLADSPGHPVAKAWMAQVDLIRRVGSYDRAAVLRAAERDPDDARAQAQAADIELADGQVEAAFDRLLGVVARAAGEPRDAARRHLLSLFDLVSPPGMQPDERVTKARARLSGLLF